MMIPTARGFAACVLAASAAVLGTALLSQYWGGLAPCELCLLQRWPWSIAIVISLIALLVGSRPALPWIAVLLMLTYAAGAAVAFYHAGVEHKWFAGPSACTTSGAVPATLEEMRRRIMGTEPVLCDQVQWSLLGVSLAGWNLLASLGMAAICGWVAARTRRLPSPAAAAT